MPSAGSNAPEFLLRQLEFAAHIRDPENQPAPSDVDPERMRVYAELFFNNLEALLGQCFPVAKCVLDATRWRGLVREFLSRHDSTTPLFPEIGQEFLAYLVGRGLADLPPFLLELCHYEWVELELSLAPEELPPCTSDDSEAVLSDNARIVLSPLARRLQYRFPVHRIGPALQPVDPVGSPVLLLVWRRRDDRIGFMELNARTMLLLHRIETPVSVAQALRSFVAGMSDTPPYSVYESGLETLARLRKAEVIMSADDAPGETKS